MEESDQAISESFAEGYKAGLLKTSGDTAYWKSIAESYESDVTAPDTGQVPWWACLLSGLGGTGIGFVINSWITR